MASPIISENKQSDYDEDFDAENQNNFSKATE